MPVPHKVHVEITSMKGECSLGHKVSDTSLIETGKTPGGVCASAWNVIFPYARVLTAGGEFHWAKDKHAVSFACLEAENPVVFQLRRLKD